MKIIKIYTIRWISLFSLMYILIISISSVSAQDYQYNQPSAPTNTYDSTQIIKAGHDFFGGLSHNFAKLIERAVAKYGLPNGYIIGEEASGAFFGGLRYGEGTLHTQNAGSYKIYWQGPSIGLDFGGDGARVMILVYDLPSIDHIFRRYVGASGSAFIVGGFGMTALKNEPTLIAPIRTGIGARLGLSISYLKFTDKPTWNPF